MPSMATWTCRRKHHAHAFAQNCDPGAQSGSLWINGCTSPRLYGRQGARVNRLLNDDGDAAAPDHGPKVSDPTAKALDGDLAYRQKLTPGPVVEPAFEVSQSDDPLVLEPEPEVPLNGGIKLD